MPRCTLKRAEVTRSITFASTKAKVHVKITTTFESFQGGDISAIIDANSTKVQATKLKLEDHKHLLEEKAETANGPAPNQGQGK